MVLAATYFGANGWHLRFDEVCILVDPWLTGDLTFAPGPWFFKGEFTKAERIPKNIDLILLTQGLPDHTHKETLNQLSRELPLVVSSKAAEVVCKMGFEGVYTLRPGEKISILGLEIKATAGAKVPHTENGYLIYHPKASLYIEPHGFLDDSLHPENIDIIISNMI